MFKFLGFGRPKPTAEAPVFRESAVSVNTRQHSDIQRELVRVVLKDLLRQHGIPATWIDCEVSAGSANARGSDVVVTLIVSKWHELLPRYLPLLQRNLVAGLDRFEPSVDHSEYTMHWAFAQDCGYPHTDMPSGAIWSIKVPESNQLKAAQIAAAQVDAEIIKIAPEKPKFDLPPSAMDKLPVNFAPTEPSTLR
jgi:hypothetical protein